MTEAIELTTFKLKGHSCADFVKANAGIDTWLKQQPGFISRHIAERDDGTIIDMLIWRSARDGEDSASRLMSELADSPVHSMIDQRTVSWTVSPVKHRTLA